MSRTLRCFPVISKPPYVLRTSYGVRWRSTTSHINSSVETDSCGVPLKPTWSVNELLSSYPKPSITPETLKKIHELSALVPPDEGTPEHAELTEAMENLVKLVEAVKVVDLGRAATSRENDVPDGRIWAEGTGIKLEREEVAKDVVHGRDLLRHAARTEDEFYVVDADRSR